MMGEEEGEEEGWGKLFSELLIQVETAGDLP